MCRHHLGVDNIVFAAMTVQQAKNREFDGVVVLWPFQVGGDAEHKRRLLLRSDCARDAHAVLASALKGISPTPEFPEVEQAQVLLTALAP